MADAALATIPPASETAVPMAALSPLMAVCAALTAALTALNAASMVDWSALESRAMPAAEVVKFPPIVAKAALAAEAAVSTMPARASMDALERVSMD